MSLPLTPSQTIGPFFSHALPWHEGPYVVPVGSPDAFWLRGRVLDGAGDPVPEAMVETWQADPDGLFHHPDDPRGPEQSSTSDGAFRGFGRSDTDADGRWAVHTLRPGRVPGPDGRLQAPHLDVSVFARGLLDRVVTRVYLPDESEANAEDPVLAELDEPRRATLVAVPAADGYTFDIRLQGDHETVFFSI